MDINELNRIAAAIAEAENSRPIADFDGLSSDAMHNMLYFPFEHDCKIQFAKDAGSSILSGSSLFMIARDLLIEISENKGIKLTAAGNLPLKLIREIYARGYAPHIYIEKGFHKVRTETDWWNIHIPHLLLPMSGLARKMHNKLLLTKKGETLVKSGSWYGVYMELLRTYCTKFNWAYNDRYGSPQTGRMGFMYLIYLMKKYGNEKRDFSFYSEKYFLAFPMLTIEPGAYTRDVEKQRQRCLASRYFEGFCVWFGLAEIEHIEKEKFIEEISTIKNSDLFNSIIL